MPHIFLDPCEQAGSLLYVYFAFAFAFVADLASGTMLAINRGT